MFSIFYQPTVDADEELKAKIFAESACGNLVPVNLMGSENGYYIITGYAHDGIATVAPDRLEGETEADYITRLTPVSLQGFVDLAAGTIEAIVINNYPLKLLQQASEFNI